MLLVYLQVNIENGLVKMAKKEHKMYQSSLKVKILLFSGVFMILSAIFSLFLYYYTTDSMKKSILGKLNAQASFFSESIDSQLASAQEMTFSLLADKSLAFLVNPNDLLTDYDRTRSYLSQQERLKFLCLSSPIISDAQIYLPNVLMKISDTSVEDMREEDFERMKNLIPLNSGMPFFFDNQLVMATSESPYRSLDKTPDLFLVISLDVNKIRESLESFNIYPNSGSMFYFTNYTDVIKTDNIPENARNLLIDLSKENQKIPDKMIRKKIDGKSYQLNIIETNYLGYFVQFNQENQIYQDIKMVHWLLLAYLFLMIGLALLFSFYFEKRVHQPLNKLVLGFKLLETGDFTTKINEVNMIGEFDYVFSSFNNMKSRLEGLIEEVVVQKNLTQKAELKQLQSQINPHFLYNSFFSLSRKIKRDDKESANELASHLANYFRFLARSDSDMIRLEEEIEHGKSYAEIQQIRFFDRLQIQFSELDETFKNMAVPRLILQPIIENAFDYALENLEEDGLLKVSFLVTGKTLIIRVEDNGEDITDEEIKALKMSLLDKNVEELTAIININRRLKLFLGDKSGIEISRSSLGGLCVDLILST